jgi:hypothetical protein
MLLRLKNYFGLTEAWTGVMGTAWVSSCDIFQVSSTQKRYNFCHLWKPLSIIMCNHLFILYAYFIHTLFWFENMKGKDHSEDIDVDGKKILE